MRDLINIVSAQLVVGRKSKPVTSTRFWNEDLFLSALLHPSLCFVLLFLVTWMMRSPLAKAQQAEKQSAQPEPAATQTAEKRDSQAVAKTGDNLTPFDFEAWAKKHRKYNSRNGGTGGIRLIDPTTGAPGSVRFQLSFDGFGSQDFLNPRDEVQQVSQALSVSWTPLSIFEIFGSYSNSATEASFYDMAANDTVVKRRKTYHVMGDALLGFKVGGNVTNVFSAAGDIDFLLPNKEGGILPGFKALGVRLRASGSTDLREMASPVPLILRFNVGYLFDQSAELMEETEKNRYNDLDEETRLPKKYEIRHLITRVERFALGISRVDFFSLGLGLEVPMIRLVDSFYLHPLVELNIDIPVNRRGFTCASGKDENGDIAPDLNKPKGYIDDKCLDDEGINSIPTTLEFGTRIVTPIRGLTALAAASLGLSGTTKFVREIVPTPHYRLIGAIAYDYDARPPEADRKLIERRVEIPPPVKGRVIGQVVTEGTGAPVADAALQVSGSELSPVMTRADGRFISYALDPGPVNLEIIHPRFDPGQCPATIGKEGGDISVTCSLRPLPDESLFKGKVIDNWNSAVANATIILSGPNTYRITTDTAGSFEQKVTPGQYAARVEAMGYLERSESVAVASQTASLLELVVIAKPKESKITQRGKAISLGGRIIFDLGSSQLGPEASLLLADLTDYLQRNPQVRTITIAGSVDGKASSGLAYDRANAIKSRLVAYGVSPERIAVTAGKSKDVKVTTE